MDCAGHRLYQCAGYKIGVYEHKPTGTLDWSPTGAGISPLMCFPAADYVRQGNENIGFGGHDHQQDPILVCGPEIEGNVNDPTSPLGMQVRDLCTEACEARPLDTTAIPEDLAAWTGLSGEDYVLAYSVCDVGPAVDRVVDSQHGGNAVLCESIQGSPPAYPGAADVGECGGAGEFSDCPIDELETCRGWRPDKWIFSTTDRVGDVASVIHEEFLVNDVDLSTLFACDEHAYVYSGDGSGVAFIDQPDPNDFLDRLWLREGYSDFKLRARTSSSWGAWYPLNTFGQITNAFENLPSPALEYELEYDDGTGTVVRSIKVADCTASGDPTICDAADL